MINKNNAEKNSTFPATNRSPKVTATIAMLKVVKSSSIKLDTNANFKTSSVAADDFCEVDFNFFAAKLILSKIFSVVIADKISLKSEFNFCSSFHAAKFFSAVTLPIKYSKNGEIGSVIKKIIAVKKSVKNAAIKNVGRKITAEKICGATFLKKSSEICSVSKIKVKISPLESSRLKNSAWIFCLVKVCNFNDSDKNFFSAKF